MSEPEDENFNSTLGFCCRLLLASSSVAGQTVVDVETDIGRELRCNKNMSGAGLPGLILASGGPTRLVAQEA
jgi:hypothetical protein